MNEFGEFLRKSRLNRGISLRKLADKLGITPAYLSDVERGKRNPLGNEYLRLISTELNIPLESLIEKLFVAKGKIEIKLDGEDACRCSLAILPAIAWNKLTLAEIKAIADIVSKGGKK